MVSTEQSCYRHADRPAGVVCQRCDRPICPSCMSAASVGFHCPECVRGSSQQVRTMRTLVQRPVVTQVMIALNVVVFLYGLGSGGSVGRLGGEMAREGGLYGPNVDQLGEWWRIFTSGFLHDGLFHLGLNMFALWILGRIVEPAVGNVGYLALYMTSLLAGSFGALLVSPDQLTVGASGAVFGLMGAVVMVQRRVGLSIWDTGIGALIGLNLLISVTVPNISLGGHVGGLVGGLIAGWILTSGRRALPGRWAPEMVVALVGVALLFGAITVSGMGDATRLIVT